MTPVQVSTTTGESSMGEQEVEQPSTDEPLSTTDDVAEDVVDDSPSPSGPQGRPVTIDTQRQDPFFAAIIDYLQEGSLPADTQQARRIIIQSENYTIDHDLLIHLAQTRSKRLREVEPICHQVCTPPDIREALIEGYHTQLYHCGLEKTYYGLRSTHYWPQMYSQVRDHVLSCVTCQTIKTVPQPHKPPLHSLEQAELFGRLHIDHLGPLIFPKGHDPADNATKHKFLHVLIMIDAFSHNVELVPAVWTSADETAQLIFDHYITHYGVPSLGHLLGQRQCLQQCSVHCFLQTLWH